MEKEYFSVAEATEFFTFAEATIRLYVEEEC